MEINYWSIGATSSNVRLNNPEPSPSKKLTNSHSRGCAIHHTFNRAVTVHGVNNLLVKDNVAFNNLGHAYFLEDGVEEDNVFDGNLAIFTQSSSSLLNVDVTPGM